MKKLIRICSFLCLLPVLLCGVALAAEGAYVRALGTDGTTTVGARVTPGTDGTERVEMVYTTDGVNWQTGSWDWELSNAPLWGGYNGEAYIAYSYLTQIPAYRSADGVHWAEIPPEDAAETAALSPGVAQVGPYRFELSGGEVYLVNGDAAALLPDVGEALRAKMKSAAYLQAFPVPGGVRVEVYPSLMAEAIGPPAYVTIYPTSSLDWVGEHLSTISWSHESLASSDNGRVAVQKTAAGTGEGWEFRREGGAWTPIRATWSQESGGAELLPWNGRTFLVQDNWSLQLYASEDGEHWRCLKDTFLDPEQDAGFFAGFFGNMPVTYSRHAVQWTGTEYIACRRTAEGRYGMMGSGGGGWASPYCTKVCFADENFNLTGAYDFGRQVLGVGYRDGVWYAEVSDSTGLLDPWFQPDEPTDYDRDAPTALYRSADKVNWERIELGQVFVPLQKLEDV